MMYFLFFSSALCNYGLGLQTVLIKKYEFKSFLIHFCQVFFEIIISLSISWFLIQILLIPISLTAVFPIIVCLVFYFFHTIFSYFAQFLKIQASKELFIPILMILLSVLHSLSYLQAIMIAFSCLLSYFGAIPILVAIEKRIDQANPPSLFKTGALVLISLSVIMLSFLAFDLSWLLKGDF